MQSDTSERIELEAYCAKLEKALSLAAQAIESTAQHNAALLFAVTYLSREMEDRCGIDRAALFAEALEHMRKSLPDDAGREETLRNLFGQGGDPKAPPVFTLIKGGKDE